MKRVNESSFIVLRESEDSPRRVVHNEKAAEQGNIKCQFNTGTAYELGHGCEQSYKRAAEWYKKAAGQGDADAMASLGTLYHNGRGAPQSYKRAFELYQQSRALGNTDTALHFNLGLCHEFGRGVAKDYLEARRLYKLASAQGHAQSTEKLSIIDDKIRTECPLLGKRVVITGTSREDLNGRAGMATSFDHDHDRYLVELDPGRRGEKQKGKLRLKLENLVLVGRKQSKRQGK